jgi:hypothetical protein
MKTMKQLEDLSAEERAAAIGGLITAGVASVSFLVFIFVVLGDFHISDRLKSGSSLFSVAPLVLLLIYVFVILPTIFVGSTAFYALAKRSFSSILKAVLIMPLLLGAGILLPALVFTLFALTLPNLSIYVQAPIATIIILVCGIIETSVTKARKVNNHLKKTRVAYTLALYSCSKLLFGNT